MNHLHDTKKGGTGGNYSLIHIYCPECGWNNLQVSVMPRTYNHLRPFRCRNCDEIWLIERVGKQLEDERKKLDKKERERLR